MSDDIVPLLHIRSANERALVAREQPKSNLLASTNTKETLLYDILVYSKLSTLVMRAHHASHTRFSSKRIFLLHPSTFTLRFLGSKAQSASENSSIMHCSQVPLIKPNVVP